MKLGTPQTGLHDAEVVSSEVVADGICRKILAAPTLTPRLKPGQFINVHVPGDPSQILRVPLAFASADARTGSLELVFALVGDATRRLCKLPAGSTTTLVGPCGNGWQETSDTGRALIVAGGIGVTPTLALARELGRTGRPFDVVVGAQTSSKLWGISEFEQAGASEVLTTTDDGSAGMKGFTTDGMAELVSHNGYEVVYTCGPAVMMAGVARECAERHLSCQASLERMMTCGFGACSTCNVAMVAGGYKSCCTDGPVFDAKEVAW